MGEQVAFTGETLRAATFGALEVEAAAPPVLVAALGPTMLGLAARLASGTMTWMTGPSTIESHIVPVIGSAAAEAGREEPRVAVGLPVCVTTDIAAAREKAAVLFAIYGGLPSYRAMLDREGAEGPRRRGHRGLRGRGGGPGPPVGRHRGHRLHRRALRHR